MSRALAPYPPSPSARTISGPFSDIPTDLEVPIPNGSKGGHPDVQCHDVRTRGSVTPPPPTVITGALPCL